MACTAHTNTTSCTGHSTGTCAHTNTLSCSAHSVGSGSTGTETNWTDDPIATSDKIKAIHHNELRTAITAELARRSAAWPTDPGLVNSVIKVNHLHVRQLRDGIDSAQSWAHPTYLDDGNTETGDKVLKDQYNALRDQVNYLELTCSCDCNYTCTCQCNYACTCNCNYACTCQCNYACTCNCNYVACPCNCNYCTCDCNYCTCDCNYACTCDCNYACTCLCAYACTCDCNYTCTCNCAYSDKRLKDEIIYM